MSMKRNGKAWYPQVPCLFYTVDQIQSNLAVDQTENRKWYPDIIKNKAGKNQQDFGK